MHGSFFLTQMKGYVMAVLQLVCVFWVPVFLIGVWVYARSRGYESKALNRRSLGQINLTDRERQALRNTYEKI